jgi:hypothetical protein
LDNGLLKKWHGRVWCNPPYGSKTGLWLARCARHKNVIAMTFARTETRMFFEYVWNKAVAVFFLKGRLRFHHVDGTIGGAAGSPNVLIAYDEMNAVRLQNCGLDGFFVRLPLKP